MKCKKCHREITDNSLFCNWCGAKQIKDGNVSVPAPQRKKNGEYAGRIMVDGQRVYITAPTETEYYKRARAIKLELVDIKSTPANGKLVDIIGDYISKNEVVFSPSTVRGYIINLKQIGKATQKRVKEIDFQKLINKLSEEYSPKTVHNQWGLITGSLKNKGIAVPDVRLPQQKKSERTFLEPEEIKEFITAIKGKKIELTALLALHSLRESEILALTKESITGGVIHVRGAKVPNKNNTLIYREQNKTQASTRDIPVMIHRLEELWEQQEEIHFPHPSNIRRDILRICRNNALPECSCHSLRHSFCSLAYYLGWDIKTTQQIGGWSSPNVPTDIYTHLATERKNKDIKAMEDFYRNKPSP